MQGLLTHSVNMIVKLKLSVTNISRHYTVHMQLAKSNKDKAKSLDLIYIVTYYIKWDKTSWTYSSKYLEKSVRGHDII